MADNMRKARLLFHTGEISGGKCPQLEVIETYFNEVT